MSSILHRKPLVALSAIVILAIASIGLSPAFNHLAAVSTQTLRPVLMAPLLEGGPSLAVALFAAVVLFLAGVVSGLAGFAFSAVAAGVLWLLPPLQTVPLIMLLSTCNQLLSLGKLRREIALLGTTEREGALPYIIGGLVGVPAGVALLRGLPTSWFAAALGLFLIIYSALSLVMSHRARITSANRKVVILVGVLGGVVGGFSGFGASVLVVYLNLRNADKSTIRGITQPFIVVMQIVSLITLVVVDRSIFNAAFWLLWVMTLPAVLLGTTTGVALYRRLNDGNFRRAVLILLIVSGTSLVAKALV